MAKDYTKYQVDGIDGVFGKGKLVLAVVQDYCSKNECSFDELKAVFPDEAQAGNTGVFGTLEEAKEIAKKRARHYVKDPIKLSDTKIAVSNQWGDNLPLFIETAKGLGYDISAAGKTSNDATHNKSNENNAPARQGKSELEVLRESLIKGHEPWADGNDNETPGHYFAFIIMAFSFNSDEDGHDDEIDAIHNFQRQLWDVGNQITEEQYDERINAVLKWFNAVNPEGVHNWIEYGIAVFKANKHLNPRFFDILMEYLFTVACANRQITDDEKEWLSWIADCVAWDISDEIKNDLAKIGIVQDGESTNEQSAESSNEDSSNEFNTAEALSLMYLLMLYMDGEVGDGEADKLVELVTPYADHEGKDIETVVDTAIKIYNSKTIEENFELAMTFASALKEVADHESCVLIGADLGRLAWADGELHDNETKYWHNIIEAMGVSADEIYSKNEEASDDDQSEESTDEEDADVRFNAVEGITLMFRLMLSVDGEVSDDEATKLIEVVTPYVESVGEDLETVVANTLEIYNSNTLEENFKLATSFAASFSETSSHEVCVKIAKDLGKLAMADGELDDNETSYWIHIIRAMGVSVDEINGENETSVQEEEAPAEQATDQISFTTIPNHWGPEHVIVVPIRHCMVADGVVNQMEKNAMAHFFENFGEIGEASSNVWDSTDDEIMQIHSDGKYGELLTDSAIYLKEHLDDDQLSKLIWYMAEIVCEDDVIQYKEFITLKFYFDQWFPDALDTYIEKFKAAGMNVITSPDN